MGIDRRNFIAGAIGLAALHGLIGTARAAFFADPGAEATLLLQSVRRIGAAYLQLRANEASRDTLLSLLGENLSLAGETGAYQKMAGWEAGQFQKLIADDFSSGRVVNLEGWVVSETECRLCALSVIEHQL